VDEIEAAIEPEYRDKTSATRSYVRRVFRLLRELDVRTAADLDAGIYRRFEEHLTATAGVAAHPRTHGNLLAYLKAILGHVARKGFLASPPKAPALIDPREWPKAKFRLPSRDDILRLGEHLRKGSGTWEGHRLYALFSTVVLAGLRLGEALRLRVEDLDLAQGTIRVRRRDGKPRRKFPTPAQIPDELMPVLKEWLPRSGPPMEWVFPGKRRLSAWRITGTPGYAPLAQLQRAARAAGIRRKVTFEGLYRYHAANVVLSVRLRPAGRPETTTSELERLPIIRMGNPGEPVHVGKRRLPQVTQAQRAVIDALLDAGNAGLSMGVLKDKSGQGGAREILATLRQKHPVWKEVLPLPGRSWGHYRIEARRPPTG
jgi:integrase